MEKMIAYPEKQVKDVGGLYVELMKKSFAVVNVGSDQMGTYIYLDEREQKDPGSLVEEWINKPVAVLTKRDVRRMKEELDKLAPAKLLTPPPTVTILSGRPESSEHSAPVGATVEANLLEGPESSEAPAKPGFLKGFFRKLFT